VISSQRVPQALWRPDCIHPAARYVRSSWTVGDRLMQRLALSELSEGMKPWSSTTPLITEVLPRALRMR